MEQWEGTKETKGWAQNYDLKDAKMSLNVNLAMLVFVFMLL